MEIQKIRYLVRKRDFSLSDSDIEDKASYIFECIQRGAYDFSNYKREIFTQQGKKRAIYSYDKLSCEDILCQYLKMQLDNAFHIKYASRNRIINILFNVLPTVKDMNDFVIIRADFKSFFDSVLTRHVYEKYIQESMLKRSDKEMLEEYITNFKYCYAGLCLSNGMTEIVCRDFDERLKAKMSKYGIFFYERYVDDIILIANRYISEKMFMGTVDETIKEVFGSSPVKISTEKNKFSYISRRNLLSKTSVSFNFLGYEFELKKDKEKEDEDTEEEISFKYGIASKKRKRYEGIIERAFAQYKADNNLELLRQRIKMYSSRVVVARTIGSSSYDWLTKGIVANYNELRYHIGSLLPDTTKFLKNLYSNLFKTYGIKMPYFMKQSFKEDSIYNVYSNLKRNRTIVFEKGIGVSEATVLKWIKRINPAYDNGGKDYYRIVVDYLEMLKVE